jgi:hypothetical protein
MADITNPKLDPHPGSNTAGVVPDHEKQRSIHTPAP